jgi:hypothetical protein
VGRFFVSWRKEGDEEGRVGVGHRHHLLRAQLRSASGRSSKVIKDHQHVEAAVEVPGAGRLILSVDSEGQYTLRASPEGGEATTTSSSGGISTPLARGEIGAAETEPL